MKQFLLFAATVLVTLGTISQAQAKKPEDQEFRRVIVTLTSGEKVDGTCSAVGTPNPPY